MAGMTKMIKGKLDAFFALIGGIVNVSDNSFDDKADVSDVVMNSHSQV